MSVVAVKIYDKSIVMAADSIIVHGSQDKTPIGRGKIYEVNDMIIGTSGDAAEGIFMSMFAENHTPVDATERGMIEYLLEFSQWKNKHCNAGGTVENQYLIAVKDKVFYSYGGYVAEVEDSFAIGAGEYYARAALYLGHSPQEAVKAACELCCYVSEPIIVKSKGK